MSRITLNSNIAALNAQRRLGQSTSSLRDSFVRLSSGLRINSAADDAAGLAISEDLKVDARVYGQGIRNINDAISLLSVAEGATRELSNILIRQTELAEQAANGTLSNAQRTALDQEAQELSREYSRIIATTSFNGLDVLNGDANATRVQSGYGENGALRFSLGEGLAQTAGDGTYGAINTFKAFPGAGIPPEAALADFNRDGFLDIATPQSTFNNVQLLLGNGDGSFSFGNFQDTSGDNPRAITTTDLNNDGIMDLVTGDRDGQSISALLGNGDGTFQAGVSFAAAGLGVTFVDSGDFNNDGNQDIAVRGFGTGTVAILLGTGSGSFGAATTLDTATLDLAVADLNGDGRDDIVRGGGGTGDVRVFLSNGDGSFAAAGDYNLPNEGRGIALADFTGDGIIDIVAAAPSGSASQLLIGSGDGSFSLGASIDLAGGSEDITAVDINGDGAVDLIATSTADTEINAVLNNGDGTFQTALETSIGGNPSGHFVGDFNNDGAVDILSHFAGVAEFSLQFGNTQTGGSAVNIDLSTRVAALDSLDTLEAVLAGVGEELGNIGAVQSRLDTAVSNLRVMQENVITASSQISNADVAEESARLTKNTILQQAGIAVLAQANLSPQLALSLIS